MTPKQIKAARILIDWKQSDLAKAAGLSKTAVTRIESGYVLPRQNSINAIRDALEAKGVEFIDTHGVQIRSEIFEVKSAIGTESHIGYFRDIIETVQKTGGEILQSSIDDQFIMTHFRDELFGYYRALEKLNIKEKLLTCEGDEVRYGPPNIAEYRWTSKELFEQIGYTVYGDKVALFLYTKEWHHVVIENAKIAETYRQQFYKNWGKANPISLPKALYLDDVEKNR